ncbi:hypothetical protein FGO68_gene16126 [Halteria grandinella]|uniref:Major facilitator superfamily (MFS) profile domain-containing protein n=1 Tax=Halteria grandinella TaxID=5974 RepID=A0A8J8NS24_HALGN|nr:hypothetical protein FGO68_gene16126 [Halteria grandinella]
MNGFSPVAEIIARIYNCSPIIVQLQTVIFILMFVPSNFIVIFVLDKFGLRFTQVLGACMMVFGCWLRYIVSAYNEFWIISFGTAIAAYGQVSFLNTISSVASGWFGDKERAISTALGTISTPLGVIVGFIVPSAMLSEEDEKNPIEGQRKFCNYLLVQNGIATISAILLIIMARDKPPTPPSESASLPRPRFSFGKDFGNLLRNKSYLIIVLDYALLYGTVSAIGAIISSLTSPYNYSGKDNSLFGSLFISCGITGSIICGILLDKFPKYKLAVLIVAGTSVVFLLFSFITLPSSQSAIFGLNLAILGFFAVPMSPISFAFSVELTYPTPDAVSNGMMVLASKAYGALLSVVGGILTKKYSPLYAIGLFSLNNLIALIASFFIKEELRRLRPKFVMEEVKETNDKEQLIE